MSCAANGRAWSRVHLRNARFPWYAGSAHACLEAGDSHASMAWGRRKAARREAVSVSTSLNSVSMAGEMMDMPSEGLQRTFVSCLVPKVPRRSDDSSFLALLKSVFLAESKRSSSAGNTAVGVADE
ncbi:MAG: hypothetical protein Q9197_003975 [Variospora fuerteventurae]